MRTPRAKCRSRCPISSTSSRSEEHTSELQSQLTISYAVFCLKKKNRHDRCPSARRSGRLPSNICASIRGMSSRAHCHVALGELGHLLFFFKDTATTEIYTVSYTLSLHDALPISPPASPAGVSFPATPPSAVKPPRSEEHTSELQSQLTISYAVFCLKKKKTKLKTSYSDLSSVKKNNKK